MQPEARKGRLSAVNPSLPRVAIFLHAGEYDRMHQGLSIAATAVAMGRRADVFFFWWALDRLVQGHLDEPDLDGLGPAGERAADRFEARGMPTLRALLDHLRASGLCTLYACSASAALVTRGPEQVTVCVDQLVGWSTILQITAGVTDRFYL